MSDKTKKVADDATLAAVYFRTLVAEQVPVLAAIQLTSAYISAGRIAEQGDKPPREPWQEGGRDA